MTVNYFQNEGKYSEAANKNMYNYSWKNNLPSYKL